MVNANKEDDSCSFSFSRDIIRSKCPLLGSTVTGSSDEEADSPVKINSLIFLPL